MIAALISDLWPVLLAVGAGLAAFLGYGARQKARGRKDAIQEAKENDGDGWYRPDDCRNSGGLCGGFAGLPGVGTPGPLKPLIAVVKAPGSDT